MKKTGSCTRFTLWPGWWQKKSPLKFLSTIFKGGDMVLGLGRRVMFVNWIYSSSYDLDKKRPPHSFMKNMELVSYQCMVRWQVTTGTSWKYDIVTLIQGEFPQEHTVPQAAQEACAVPILGALQDLTREIPKDFYLRSWLSLLEDGWVRTMLRSLLTWVILWL